MINCSHQFDRHVNMASVTNTVANGYKRIEECLKCHTPLWVHYLNGKQISVAPVSGAPVAAPTTGILTTGVLPIQPVTGIAVETGLLTLLTGHPPITGHHDIRKEFEVLQNHEHSGRVA